ncbi:MAG: 23S rRNA (cytosine(2499)-C(5))-methyltransferase [Anaerolineae bacterium]|jgi:23S rRNA (cytosine1962-C5)-methyltransferase|nr:23S rRNA (cytosine(2499)-C(5))-methyltransferase [Anaerolineae bacterium]MBT7071194.1 23S rRNA (cytosine(2499)-C(5))-methyltransferase [Anaerolineae bacterium]MBT7324456.1 23S rRNA (cytosine(2499)-C(5))-methyltransferase [Anaerolineae bacterium]
MLKLPSPSTKRIALRVTPAAERAIRQGHPWIFEQAIREQSHVGKAGDLAVIFDKKRRFLAIGLYDPNTTIRVRILQRLKPAAINKEWFKAKLDTTSQLRAPLRDSPPKRLTNGYRLAHGENDGLPGLVIDRYAETYVIKLYTPAWIPHLNDILAALGDIFPAERIVLRLGGSLKENKFNLEDGMVLQGEALTAPIIFSENGLRFESDPVHGQKTGFFLDQRENRARVEKLAKGKRVLNVFSYTGGFSVYAARGGATEVVSLDASKPAIEAAERNFKLNFPSSNLHSLIAGDAFEVMTEMKKKDRRFEMVIIDPPSFARKASQTDGAINAYQKLTRLGIEILAPNGILVQASCSSRVESDAFFDAIHLTARRAGRLLKEIERTSHALDHPIGFREGEYLKCLFAYAP